ncbi:MAG: Smr/MutS family protein [Promethearchaeota archaeon]
MKCDLHGFRLFDAIEEVINFIEVCLSSGDRILFIIHGYRHGQVLKNYFRSKEFLEDMKDERFNLKELSHPNLGVSMYRII